MSNQNGNGASMRPRVIAMERPETRTEAQSGPRVIETAETGRIAPAPPAQLPAAPAKRSRRSFLVKLGLAGLTIGFCGWLVVDLYLWITAAFQSSTTLGWTATAAATLGLGAAFAIIVHELRSYFSLKHVEENREHLTLEEGRTPQHGEVQRALGRVMAGIPLDAETKSAIETFQRQLQAHHSPAQQIEIFSNTVMTPLDRRAESIVRRTSARAFGITAISPTAIIDAIFFIAISIRMVREIATCYGHRPTAVATVYLLRRLVVEAAKLGAVDLAGAAITQHIGGAIAERVAASAAESIYATQRMARLGLVTMSMCRPVPFRKSELPGIMSSLVGNLFKRTSDPT